MRGALFGTETHCVALFLCNVTFIPPKICVFGCLCEECCYWLLGILVVQVNRRVVKKHVCWMLYTELIHFVLVCHFLKLLPV